MKSSWLRFAVPVLAGVALLSSAAAAAAAVRHEGDWDDDDDDEITLNLEHVPRGEAIKRLADAAGWNVVFENAPSDPVDVHVKEESPSKVLEILLANDNYVARRDDKLIAIRRDTPGAVPAVPATPATPATPAPASTGSDRSIKGGNFTVQKNETVHDVEVLGGNLDVYGTVTGDAQATGGNIRIHKGGQVLGDAQSLGGSVYIEDDASISGDVQAVGGSVHRDPRAHVGGDLHENTSKHDHEHGRSARRDRHDRVDVDIDHDDLKAVMKEATEMVAGPPASLAEQARGHVTVAALLFVFGAVMRALLAARMDKLRVQIASSPMSTFAIGIVGLLGICAAIGALFVTVVGIPFAVAFAVLVFFGATAGVTSVLETLGAALLGHRTKNPYLHLACGCALGLIVSAIPYARVVVYLVMFFTGLGAFVKTGGAFGKRKLRGVSDSDAYA